MLRKWKGRGPVKRTAETSSEGVSVEVSIGRSLWQHKGHRGFECPWLPGRFRVPERDVGFGLRASLRLQG